MIKEIENKLDRLISKQKELDALELKTLDATTAVVNKIITALASNEVKSFFYTYKRGTSECDIEHWSGLIWDLAAKKIFYYFEDHEDKKEFLGMSKDLRLTEVNHLADFLEEGISLILFKIDDLS